ncbi:MAG TPA: M23 family metallopeptidase [Vicinamibacterales bacterium]|nr:M23 family metallopeptidase [Vicinamibacterales bacterium]
MRFIRRLLLFLIVIALITGGVMWYLAGREPGPQIAISAPKGFVGQKGTLTFTVDTPDGKVNALTAVIEQNGQQISLVPEGGVPVSEPHQELSLPLGKAAQPALVSGAATIRIAASRPVLYGYRTASSSVSQDVQVRLEAPRVSVLSLHQFINLGGAEFVVLRATPADVQAGVKVGDAEYPAYPGTAVGIADPNVRVAFFALRWDQDVNTPVSAFARDVAGNQGTTPVEHKPFPKAFVKSKIPIDQRFLDRVVPAIASESPGVQVDTSSPEGLLKGFLTINGDLRAKNADTIRGMAAKTQPQMLWTEAFAQMGNTQVESRFADQRTYFFDNKEIDHQVHLGFDLASVQHGPVHAANAGVVLFANFLGIYGNCIIIDHGLGVQSLYGHLSSFEVKEGDKVSKNQEIGRTGITGLAGGDHLHFTMLLQGTPVNPVEWWDPHWMQDRVFRKVKEAGTPGS